MKLLEESANWDLLIDLVLFIYHIVVNRSTQLLSYIIVYEIKSQFPRDQLSKQILWDHMMNMIEGMSKLHDCAKITIKYA